MKLLRDQVGFFYFRVTISLNNAWLWGGVAQGLRGAEVHSWVKLYIIITAAEVAAAGASTVMPFMLFNIRASKVPANDYLEYLQKFQEQNSKKHSPSMTNWLT